MREAAAKREGRKRDSPLSAETVDFYTLKYQEVRGGNYVKEEKKKSTPCPGRKKEEKRLPSCKLSKNCCFLYLGKRKKKTNSAGEGR